MTTLVIPPGTVFGRWAVIEEVRANDRRAILCRCECGTTRVVYLHRLKAGRSTSCGCGQREGVRLDVPPGTVFGQLAVIGDAAPAADGARRMLCRCKCGNQTTAHLKNLRSGHAKSCGCHGMAQPDLSKLGLGEVPLWGKKARGRVTVVDEGDWALVMQYRWRVAEPPEGGRTYGPYAAAVLSLGGGRRRTVLMHQLLTGWPLTDHIDGDGLNNRRSNLRAATNRQNVRNSRSRAGTSQFKGVFRQSGKWRVGITVDGKKIHLGYFTDEVEAARAYDAAALQLHGEFARLNFPAHGSAA